MTEDGKEISFVSIIWCTGFHPGFDWIDLPILDEHGDPRHRYGKSTDLDGLYFVGPISNMLSLRPWARCVARVAGWIAAAKQG